MAKLIAVTEPVYTRLKKLKGNQSFSTAINKLLDRKSGDLSKYFGVWRARKDLDDIEADIMANRRAAGSRRARALNGG